jgi:hypothetical protein
MSIMHGNGSFSTCVERHRSPLVKLTLAMSAQLAPLIFVLIKFEGMWAAGLLVVATLALVAAVVLSEHGGGVQQPGRGRQISADLGSTRARCERVPYRCRALTRAEVAHWRALQSAGLAGRGHRVVTR